MCMSLMNGCAYISDRNPRGVELHMPVLPVTTLPGGMNVGLLILLPLVVLVLCQLPFFICRLRDGDL
jgi:hypothetical protein